MKIVISKYKNKLYLQVDSIKTLNFIDKNFSILAHENIKFVTAVKEHRWDGKIKYLDEKTSSMRIGLLVELLRFCKLKNIEYELKFSIKNEVSEEKIKTWIKTLNLPFELKDYQFNVFYDLVRYKNITAQSEMGSGKSLIIYLVIRFMLQNNFKTMLIVPNIGLLYQMKKDFLSYGWKDSDEYLQIIGDRFIKKEFKKPVIISTWQSLNAKRMKLYTQTLNKRQNELIDDLKNLSELEFNNKKVIIEHTFKRLKSIITEHLKKFNILGVKRVFSSSPKTFPNHKEILSLIDEFEENISEEFNTIDCVIGDECDLSTGDALNHLLDKFQKSRFRLGLTGTMPKKEYANWYTIVSNFGKFAEYNTYRELADRGILSDITVIINHLNYPIEERIKYHEVVPKSSYQQALYYTSKVDIRNDYIVNLVNSFGEENTLLIFLFKAEEGYFYYKYYKDRLNNKLVYVDGNVKGRDKLVSWMKETKEKYCCLGSVNTMSRGINIPNLQHLVVLSSFKNREGVGQMVGRLSRLFGNNKATVHDIVDNFVMEDEFKRLQTNLSVKHYFDKLETYKEKQYKIEEIKIDLK